MDHPTQIVEHGYDAMADAYLDYTTAAAGDDPRLRFLDALLQRLPDASDVVDLGCGAGVPATERLARRHRVLGVDVSAVQLARATANVPRARFRKTDFAELDLDAESLDAATAFYSMTHVPRERHLEVLQRISSWLRPGGHLLLTLSATGQSNGVEDDFRGVPMYFSGFGPERNRELLDAAGFDIVLDEIVPLHDADASVFQYVLAQLRQRT